MIQPTGGYTFAQLLQAFRNNNQQSCKIVFEDGTEIGNENLALGSLDYSFYMNESNDLNLNTAPAAHISVELLNYNDELSDVDFTGEFTVYLGIDMPVESDEEEQQYETVWHSIGTFIGQQPEKVFDDAIRLEGYDRMVLFDREAQPFFDSLTFPMTAENIFYAMCTYVDCPHVLSLEEGLVNKTKSITLEELNGMEMSCRDVLACLAEAMGGYARIGADGLATIKWFENHTSDYTATADDYFEIDVAEYSVPVIDKLRIRATESDVGVIVSEEGGTNCYDIIDNIFLYGYSDAEIRPYAQNLYAKLHGFATYTPARIEVDGCWLIEAGDIITIEKMDDTTIPCPIFNVVMHWDGMATTIYENTGSRSREPIKAVNYQRITNGRKIHEIYNTIDQFSSLISAKARVYVQWAEPTGDIHEGDIWIKQKGGKTWGEVAELTWGEVSATTWGELAGYSETFVYVSATHSWKKITSDYEIAELQTEIKQTAYEIIHSAKDYVNGKLTHYSTTDQTALNISMYVRDNAYGIQSGIDILAEGIEISGGKYVKIKTGGAFIVESGQFSIDENGNATFAGTMSASCITSGTLDCSQITVSNLSASSITTGNLSASRISGGTLDCSQITVSNLSASSITTGSLNASRISGGTLDCSQITVSNLNASSITAGTLSASRISGGTLDCSQITVSSLSASSITTGTLDCSHITVSNLSASSITSGSLSASRISGGTLTLGGNGNANGTIIMKNASGAQIGSWNNSGLSAQGTLKSGSWSFDSNGVGWSSTGSIPFYMGLNIGTVNAFGISYNHNASPQITTMQLFDTVNGAKTFTVELGSSACTVSSNINMDVLAKNVAPAGTGDKRLGASDNYWKSAYITTVHNGSSRQIKHNIVALGDYGSIIDRLSPVSFVYNSDATNHTRFGLIYEDAVTVLPEICYGGDEEPSIVYGDLIPILLKEIQSLRSRVAALENAS